MKKNLNRACPWVYYVRYVTFSFTQFSLIRVAIPGIRSFACRGYLCLANPPPGMFLGGVRKAENLEEPPQGHRESMLIILSSSSTHYCLPVQLFSKSDDVGCNSRWSNLVPGWSPFFSPQMTGLFWSRCPGWKCSPSWILLHTTSLTSLVQFNRR